MKFNPLQIALAILGSVLSIICAVGVSYLSEMSHSITDLNMKVGIVMTNQQAATETAKDHEIRLREVERAISIRPSQELPSGRRRY